MKEISVLENGRQQSDKSRLVALSLIAIAVALSWGVASQGVIGLVFALVVCASAATLMAIVYKGHKVFWAALLFLLLGYQFLGKGFAYIGTGTLFVGEIGLAVGLVTGLLILVHRGGVLPSTFRRPQIALLLALMLWNAARTIPYLQSHGFDALRDATLWGYATFALLICFLIPRTLVERFFVFYGRIIPVYLVWVVIAIFLMKLELPRFPGSPIEIVRIRAGEVGVHLAAIAAFLLLRLDQADRPRPTWKIWLLWLLWGAAFVEYGASAGRAAMLSALMGLGVVFLWRWKTRWDRPLVLAVTAVALLLAIGPPAGYQERTVERVTKNVDSLVGEGPEEKWGTVRWRLVWWQEIVDYTFNGQYFWGGKGYGRNVALEDGFAALRRDRLLRSPHNATMTFLARSGVPGVMLWLAFVASMTWMLVKQAIRGRKRPEILDTRYAVWLLAFWLAFHLNASFDVFLEGPMGGIWFWSLVGMILVYTGERPSSSHPESRPYGVPASGSAIRAPL